MVKKEINALTGIRLFAALYVLLFHFVIYFCIHLFPEAFTGLFILLGNGWLGVDLFFLLSGFILAYNYNERFKTFSFNTYFSFLVKRVARIYPVHILTVALVVVAVIVKSQSVPEILQDEGFSDTELIKQVLLVHGWTVPITKAWNVVSWSVSSEWLAYLCFPLVMALSRNFKTKSSLIITMLLLHILLLTSFQVFSFKGAMAYGVFRISTEFTIGVLLYKLFQILPKAEHNEERSIDPKIGPKNIGWLLLFILSLGIPVSMVWAIPVFAYLILRSAQGQLAFNSVLSKSWAVYGGKISYALYLVHGAVLEIYMLFLTPESMADASLLDRSLYAASFVGLSVLGAVFAYHCVEAPGRKLIIKMVNKKETPRSA